MSPMREVDANVRHFALRQLTEHIGRHLPDEERDLIEEMLHAPGTSVIVLTTQAPWTEDEEKAYTLAGIRDSDLIDGMKLTLKPLWVARVDAFAVLPPDNAPTKLAARCLNCRFVDCTGCDADPARVGMRELYRFGGHSDVGLGIPPGAMIKHLAGFRLNYATRRNEVVIRDFEAWNAWVEREEARRAAAKQAAEE